MRDDDDMTTKAVENDSKTEALAQLKDLAFETLLNHPGCDYVDWQNLLVEECAGELIEAYGSNPFEVLEELSKLWETPYHDRRSNLEYRFREWAEAFATEMSVQMYRDLI